MPLQTIQIARHGNQLDTLDHVDCLADWAIHEALWCDRLRGNWAIIHIPTRRVALWTATKRAALAARREFVGSGEWAFNDPAAMTAEQRALGREIKARWEGK